MVRVTAGLDSTELAAHCRERGLLHDQVTRSCSPATRKNTALPPGQIEPILADRGLYIGSEGYVDQVLHAQGQVCCNGRARLPQEPRPVPRLSADGGHHVWSWNLTYLQTNVPGIWLYVSLMVDIWSLKFVALDVAEREESQIAADLVSRARMRERIPKRSPILWSSNLEWHCLATGF